MKDFLLKIITFLLPVLLALFFLPVNERLKYQGMKDDCFNHGIWVYDRIFNNSKKIDKVFLGSSHTINAINDQLISSDNTQEAVNFGYCRYGRNLEYIILKEILKQKKLNTVVLEIREEENYFSHPIFPYIANTAEVALAYPFYNPSLFSDVFTHLSFKLELTQEFLYKSVAPVPVQLNEYGFSTHEDTASGKMLDEVKWNRNKLKEKYNRLEDFFNNAYPKAYLNKIKALCNENHIAIYFLYLPSYGNYNKAIRCIDFYSKMGKVLIPPKEIFENKTNWFDENHFNQDGAKKLSEWIKATIS